MILDAPRELHLTAQPSELSLLCPVAPLTLVNLSPHSFTLGGTRSLTLGAHER